MEEGIFNPKDLKLCDVQYTIRWHDVSNFMIGEKVFLISNIEHPMVVYDILDNKIITTWKNIYGDDEFHDFQPECILQYRYASMITIRKTFILNLN